MARAVSTSDAAPPGGSRIAFAGFPANGLALLRGLERNNDRTWFAARKERYEGAVLRPMREYVELMSAALHARKIPIYGTAARSVFRVYRDIRFSPDKRPYRTHAAAYLSRDAGRATPGGLYVRIAPVDAMLAVTFFRLDAANLAAWRHTIAQDPARLTRVLRSLARAGLALDDADTDDMLARMPRGFEAYAHTPHADLLRRKSFTIRRRLTRAEITSPEIVALSLSFVRASLPFLRFGWGLADGLADNAHPIEYAPRMRVFG